MRDDPELQEIFTDPAHQDVVDDVLRGRGDLRRRVDLRRKNDLPALMLR